MKKATKAAIFVTAAAALYGAAAYGVTRTLMDVAMKREAPKALKNKSSAQLTGEKRDEPYREAQRAAAKKLASLETETVLLENREGLTLVGHLRECEKAKRLVIAFHGWRSAWYRDFGLLADFLSREQCSVLYVEQRAQNESEGDYIGFGLTERYDCVDWANWAAERFPGLPVYLMGVSLGGATVLMAAGDILPAAVHGVIADSAYTSPRAIWQHVMGKNLHLPVRAATVIADLLCQKRLNASSGSYSTVEACTTFVGQNYGAGQIKRCKKTMQLSFLEGAIATFVSVVVLLLSARSLLAIFNSDPEVIAIGYIRLATILPAYVFCLIYEILSGYLRGFGISLVPALLTMLGVCGIRIAWVKFVFPTSMTFQTVMWVYPISLGVTAVLILCAVLIYRPSKRFASLETEEADK